MSLPDLTPDEQYIRSYYLSTEFKPFQSLKHEIPILAPAIIIAIYAVVKGVHDAMWIGFLYLLGSYIWRFSSPRWGRAVKSLFGKYECRIAEMERAANS